MKLYRKIFGEGTPVVILHGLFGSSDNWITFGKNLSEKGYRTILADLRNHGQSPHDPEFNLTVLADDVAELLQSETKGDAVIVGHSLGGKTAMKTAFLFPKLLSGLVVLDIAPRQYSVHHRNILDALLSVDFSKVNSRKEAEEILAGSIDEISTRQFLLKNLYWKTRERLGWRFNLDVINKEIENVGESVYPENSCSTETLFIKGSRSDYITYDDERDIFNHFDHVEVKTAPGSGHWIHADNPGWLLDEMVHFLEKLSGK